MQDSHILLEVSAFSGLAGALLTQLINSLNRILQTSGKKQQKNA